MTNEAVIQAVIAWLEATVPAIAGRTYDYAPAGKPKGLPDAAVAVEEEGVALDDRRFPIFQLEQAGTYVWELAVSVMVEQGVDEAAHRAAALTLREYFQALGTALLADHTLGGRVPSASPWSWGVDYRLPHVVYADGTRGRQAVARFAVADPVTVE